MYIYHKPKEKDEVSWNWILSAFNQKPIENIKKEKAVLLINKISQDNESTYAIALGNAYFLLDNFCDRNFALNFAERIKLNGVKNSTLKSPNLIKNKTINTYISYSDLEIGSGDSVAKLKIKADLGENFTLFNPTFEIGNSIKLNLTKPNLNSVIECIEFIEKTLLENDIQQELPVFIQLKNEEQLKYLNQKLDDSLENCIINNTPAYELIIPELEIYGTDEIICKTSDIYELKYKRNTKEFKK